MVTRWRITVPNKQYNGVTEGVAFVQGEALVSDEILKNVLVVNYGYSAELVEDEAEVTGGKKGRK